MVYAASQFVRKLRHVAFADYYILKTHIFTWNNKHILFILLILLLFSSMWHSNATLLRVYFVHHVRGYVVCFYSYIRNILIYTYL